MQGNADDSRLGCRPLRQVPAPRTSPSRPCALAAAQPPNPPPAPVAPPPSVKVGDKAPGFSLSWFAPKAGGGYEQANVSLDQYRGKQTVVLAFFPAAFSPGCTNELKQYQASASRTSAANTVVLGGQRRQHVGQPRVPRTARRRVPDPQRLQARGRACLRCPERGQRRRLPIDVRHRP